MSYKYVIIKEYNPARGQNTQQHEKIKSLLDHLCGLKNDSLLNSQFKIGIMNNKGELIIYFAAEPTFLPMLIEKLKLIYHSASFEDYEMIDVRQDHFKCAKMKMKYNSQKKIVIAEPQMTFIESLLGALYSKTDDINIVEISLKPILGENVETTIDKHSTFGNKILKGTLKGLTFIAESMFPQLENSKSENQTTPKDQQSEYDRFRYLISINIGVSSNNESQNKLIVRLRNIASIFSQLNRENVFYYETSNYENSFVSNEYNISFSTQEIIQFLYLPDEMVLNSVMGSSDTKILIEKNIPKHGICLGNQMNSEPVHIATPKDILTPKKYKNIYTGKSTIETSSQIYKDLKNAQIIDNLCKCQLIMGVPGTGKSEFIASYAINCLHVGLPFILMDPKYDTQKRLIESIPEQYMNNIEFLDLGDLVYPPALNIFRRRKKDDPTENGLITTSFISYMKKQFDRSWGYNIERMIQMTTDAILLDDISTMSEFYFMLTEECYRKTLIEIIKSKLDEPIVENKSRLRQLLKYWSDYQQRYEKNPTIVNKEIEPVMNKIGSFIGNRFINAIVSQRESYDFKSAGDKGKSVIINIPEGIISSDNMSLLSGFICKAIWTDFQSRDDMDMASRFPVQWIIDEAHTMIDDEMAAIMTKARSRRLGLTFAAQKLSTLDMKGAKMSEIILDTCKTKIMFKIGSFDAREICDEFAPLTANDLANCPDHYYYGKILLPNGTVSKPFYAKTPTPKPVLRNYDDYKQNHRSGRLTINEIEDDIENRLEGFSMAQKMII